MARMTGNRFIARMLEAYGISSIFQVPTAFFGVMAEMEDMDIKRVVTHGEKAAAYMADGYARASKGPGICMAQSIGVANLAAGLADAYMGLSPVIAMTGAIPGGAPVPSRLPGIRPLFALCWRHQVQLSSRQGGKNPGFIATGFSRSNIGVTGTGAPGHP